MDWILACWQTKRDLDMRTQDPRLRDEAELQELKQQMLRRVEEREHITAKSKLDLDNAESQCMNQNNKVQRLLREEATLEAEQKSQNNRVSNWKSHAAEIIEKYGIRMSADDLAVDSYPSPFLKKVGVFLQYVPT
jgi:hypothetical protein